MLIFHDAKLVIFSIPRTGSTSLHAALGPRADLNFARPPNKKHMTVRRFENWSAEKACRNYRRLAVMREPLSRVASWYRYRQRDDLRGQPNSTEDMSFEDFVRGTFLPEPPPACEIGNQARFLTGRTQEVAVDDLFCMERLDVLLAHLEELFGPLKMPHKNAAPLVEFDLSAELETELREHRAAEFALYDRVAQSGRLSLG